MYFSQTTANLISHFNYGTEKITKFATPTPLAAPLGMNFFRGYLLYAELLGNKIARYDLITNQTIEYPLSLSLLGPAVVRATFNNLDCVCFTASLSGANRCIGVVASASTPEKLMLIPTPASHQLSPSQPKTQKTSGTMI
jgi:hypothetical protein